MCRLKNLPRCATEATLALSFPRQHWSGFGKLTVLLALIRIREYCCKQHIVCPSPNMVLISGCLLHLARRCCRFAQSFCMTPQPARQMPGWPKGEQPMEGSRLSVDHGFRNSKVENCLKTTGSNCKNTVFCTCSSIY